jgi:hypothetical protein
MSKRHNQLIKFASYCCLPNLFRWETTREEATHRHSHIFPLDFKLSSYHGRQLSSSASFVVCVPLAFTSVLCQRCRWMPQGVVITGTLRCVGNSAFTHEYYSVWQKLSRKWERNENVIKACELPLKTGVAFSSRHVNG